MMTKEQFYDEVYDFGTLRSFCWDQGYDEFVNDIMDESEYDTSVCEEIRDMTYNYGWDEVKNWLNELPSGYDYYRKDDNGEYEGLSDQYFNLIRDELEEQLDRNGFFDEDVDDDDEVFEDSVSEDDAYEVSYDELMSILRLTL